MGKKLLLFLLCCLLLGCSGGHKVAVHFVQPAANRLHLSKLTIRPFKTEPRYQHYATNLTSSIKAEISRTGFIQLYENGAYPRLEGTLSIAPVRQNCQPEELFDNEGRRYYGHSCLKQIQVSAIYTIFQGNKILRHGSPINTIQEDFDRGGSETEVLSRLKFDQQLYSDAIQDLAYRIVDDISPRRTKDYLFLQEGKHPDLKQGIAYMAERKYTQALNSFHRVIQDNESVNNEKAIAYYNSAVLYMKQDDMNKAFKFCYEAKELMPSESLYSKTFYKIRQHFQAKGDPIPDIQDNKLIIPDEKVPQIVVSGQTKVSTIYENYKRYAVMRFTGQVVDDSPIKTLTAGDIPLRTDKEGYFDQEVKVLLDDDGQGTTTLAALDSHGNFGDKTVTTFISEGYPTEPAKPLLSRAKYYALVIGIDRYEHHTDLHSAVNDAEKISNILEQDYGFTVESLLDQQATREGIINKLLSYKNLTANDQLLIFYAGHGLYNETKENYYWLASNAGVEEDANWIDTERVSRIIRNNPATNILLVIDSCFAGTFRTPVPKKHYDSLQKTFSRRSRILIASAGNEPASDGYIHSIFAKPFIQGLLEMKEQRFTSRALYNRYIDGAVGEQETKHGTFTRNSEGDFVFQRKRF